MLRIKFDRRVYQFESMSFYYFRRSCVSQLSKSSLIVWNKPSIFILSSSLKVLEGPLNVCVLFDITASSLPA